MKISIFLCGSSQTIMVRLLCGYDDNDSVDIATSLSLEALALIKTASAQSELYHANFSQAEILLA